VNIGQLARERHPAETVLVGFSPTPAHGDRARVTTRGHDEREHVRRAVELLVERVLDRCYEWVAVGTSPRVAEIERALPGHLRGRIVGHVDAEPATCPADGTPAEPHPNVVEWAIERAIDQDAEVLAVRDHDELDADDGIAAVLRF
jgi:erythromycin esterase-like protein